VELEQAIRSYVTANNRNPCFSVNVSVIAYLQIFVADTLRA
jgi:hypothetical protein